MDSLPAKSCVSTTHSGQDVVAFAQMLGLAPSNKHLRTLVNARLHVRLDALMLLLRHLYPPRKRDLNAAWNLWEVAVAQDGACVALRQGPQA